MEVQFTKQAENDLEYWEKNDPKKVDRIEQLCHDIIKHPFRGIGKPEPLQWDLQGYWSRRITKRHRLVYAVEKDVVVVVSCRHHY